MALIPEKLLILGIASAILRNQLIMLKALKRSVPPHLYIELRQQITVTEDNLHTIKDDLNELEKIGGSGESHGS